MPILITVIPHVIARQSTWYYIPINSPPGPEVTRTVHVRPHGHVILQRRFIGCFVVAEANVSWTRRCPNDLFIEHRHVQFRFIGQVHLYKAA